MAKRLRDDAEPESIRTLWMATAILTGLRHRSEQINDLIKEIATMVLGMRGLEESWVYQDILAKGLAEGELNEAKKILLSLGRKRLGQPDEQVLARIAGLGDLKHLNLLIERVYETSSWDDLLATSGT